MLFFSLSLFSFGIYQYHISPLLLYSLGVADFEQITLSLPICFAASSEPSMCRLGILPLPFLCSEERLTFREDLFYLSHAKLIFLVVVIFPQFGQFLHAAVRKREGTVSHLVEVDSDSVYLYIKLFLFYLYYFDK